jgi:hypothetical protein
VSRTGGVRLQRQQSGGVRRQPDQYDAANQAIPTPVVYLYLEKIRVNVNRRRGHTVADEVVPDGPVADAGIPARQARSTAIRGCRARGARFHHAGASACRTASSGWW